MQINWLYPGFAAFVVYFSIFGFFVSKRRWTRAGLGVGLANMILVSMNIVAPIRGVLDPDYLGYHIGLIHVDPGVWVTITAGSIVVLALSSACFAALNLRGRAMAFVAVVDSAFLILIGFPVMYEGLANSADFKIQLGEYLFIPGMIAVLISAMLLVVPIAASVVWSAKRIRNGSDR